MQTIYALSSGSVPAGIAVIRVSGPLAGDALVALCGSLPKPRAAALRLLRRSGTDQILDRGLAIWFPGPSSYTGENLAELHVHGSRAVIRAVFDVLSEIGARMAEPGEFSRRAFDNGKLDLTEIEGLADLIAAETEMQRRQAVAQAGGHLARLAEAWRVEVIDLRAELEARLDFSDEGDVGVELPRDFWTRLASLRESLADALSTSRAGERIREGFRIAILGRPNAGKSSLLNALARRDVAIVTDEPGTTRDVLEVALDLKGYPALAFDTAGLREAASAAEQEGIRRARLTAEAADLVLWLEEAGQAPEELPSFPGVPIWRLISKSDLLIGERPHGADLAISAETGDGLDLLIERIAALVEHTAGSAPALVARQRQQEAIAAALAALEQVPGSADEVAADLLRSAGDGIGRLTGRIDVEDVLDRLFAGFCIGK